jgi:hemolysin-activating ACP:hemolysin acyltransferase
MITKGSQGTLWSKAWPFLVALGMIVLFYSAGAVFMDGYVLDLGSIMLPTVRYIYFVLFWIVLGTGATIFLTWGGLRLVGNAHILKQVQGQNEGNSDKRFIAIGALLGFVVPCLIRVLVLQGVPLTDDESCYR